MVIGLRCFEWMQSERIRIQFEGFLLLRTRSMFTFFHGWRRKAGVLTLLLACVVMGGWVRSLAITDYLRFIDRTESYCLDSTSGMLFFLAGEPNDGVFPAGSTEIETISGMGI